MAYQPIENYGIIGDMHSVALVGMNGSIDWFCFPHFDSPSVFAALLDDAKGGRFCVCPANEAVVFKQFYWPDTNVLVTRYLSPDGEAPPAEIGVRCPSHEELTRVPARDHCEGGRGPDRQRPPGATLTVEDRLEPDGGEGQREHG